jgi:tetratricopeptide (TPR) repeat protein
LLCAAALHGEGPEALVRAGDALDEKNKNAEALSLYLDAEARSQDDAEILRRISKQYAQLMLDAPDAREKRLLGEKAIDAARRAVTVGPGNSQAHLALAIAYGRAALDESARRKVEMSRLVQQEAEAAARLDPRNDLAWHVLGRWNYELANLNPFLKALAQTVYGRLPDASNQKAVECFQKAVALQPRRVAHHLELGRSYLALGERQRAQEQFNEGISLPSTEKSDEDDKRRALATLGKLR